MLNARYGGHAARHQMRDQVDLLAAQPDVKGLAIAGDRDEHFIADLAKGDAINGVTR
jgi:hypothetical protein